MTSLPPISLEDWHARAERWPYRGHSIAVQHSAGTAEQPVLLLIHGFPTCSWDWAWIWQRLAARFTLLCPDLMDYGISDNPAGTPCSIHDQADMLTALLAQYGVSRYHILAHDVGDTVAQELLARRQDWRGPDIRSALFLNGGILPDLHRPRPIQRMLAGPFGPLLARLTSKSRMTAGLAEVFGPTTQPDDGLKAALFQAALGVNGKPALARRIRYMAERRAHAVRWVTALKQPDVPMHLINGTADPVSGGHAADGFAKAVPHASITRLAGIGHFPQIEAPDAVYAAITAFHDQLEEAHRG